MVSLAYTSKGVHKLRSFLSLMSTLHLSRQLVFYFRIDGKSRISLDSLKDRKYLN